MWNLKNTTTSEYNNKKRRRLTDVENKVVLTSEWGERKIEIGY